MLVLGVLLLLGPCILCSHAFDPKPVEGTWYLQRYGSQFPDHEETSCMKMIQKWHNDTTLFGTKSFKLPNGEVATEKFLVQLKLTESEVHFDVLVDKDGQWVFKDQVNELKFSKSINIALLSSDIYYKNACYSRKPVPDETDLAELNELCPLHEHKVYSQENCSHQLSYS